MEYSEGVDGLTEADLTPFFVGWPVAPSPAARLAMLRGSYRAILAREDGRVVGFVNAISDGLLAAYIPLLEVLPDHQGRGVGHELARRMIESLGHLYMVDLVCDPELVSFYEPLGMTRLAGMAIRNRGAIASAD